MCIDANVNAIRINGIAEYVGRNGTLPPLGEGNTPMCRRGIHQSAHQGVCMSWAHVYFTERDVLVIHTRSLIRRLMGFAESQRPL